MEGGLSSFWGPVTAAEWCEKNYVYSSYIAEFFNTISIVPGIILALIGLINALRQRFEKSFSVLHISNLILAIGSMLYHSTLQRNSRVVWEMLLYFYILYSPDWHYRSTKPIFLLFYGVGFAVVHVGFKVHYVIPCLLCMYKYYIYTTDVSAKLYVATLFLGSICWLAYRVYCEEVSTCA